MEPARTLPGHITMRDGTRIAVYDDAGLGRPVVLLHAWGLRSRMWNPLSARLRSNGMRTIAIDRRGHGASDVTAEGYDLATLTNDIDEVLDAIDISDVVLIGHSFGGLEAAVVASRNVASRVSSLVLSAPTTPCLVQRRDNPSGVPADLVDAGRQAMTDDLGGWIATNTTGFWGDRDGLHPVETAWTQQQIFATPLHVLLATNDTMLNADIRDEVAQIDLPTLVMHGDADLSVPFEVSGRPTHELIPHSTLDLIRGAGHGMYSSHIGAYAAAIAPHLTTR